MNLTSLDILGYRKRAVAWLEYACQGNPPLDSPRHLEIKEGRRTKGYSSCGDLAHWMYYRLGIRLPWVNRDEHLGWACGGNISLLAEHAKSYHGVRLEGGDVIVIANDWPRGSDAHVICIIDEPQLPGLPRCIDTAESGLPGNGLQRRMLPLNRQIRVVLNLEQVLLKAAAAELLKH